MSRRVRIEVNAGDIAHGERHSCRSCPVALAVAREFPWTSPIVDGCTVDFGSDGESWLWAEAPDAVNAFIEAFDGGKPVTPFAFDLDVPDEVGR